MRSIAIFVGTVVLSVVLLWFGFVLLTKAADLSTLGFFLLGIAAFVGAIYSLPVGGHAMWVSAGLALVSVFFFLRGLEVINRPWMTQSLGAASIFAALLVVYIGWQALDNTSKKPRPKIKKY